MSILIYHITTVEQWNLAQQAGYVTAPSLETEGFIHCSHAHQVEGVLQRYFIGVDHILKLTIDVDKLTSLLKEELAPSINENFPHIYGVINLSSIAGVEFL